jgi:hypothetical protein
LGHFVKRLTIKSCWVKDGFTFFLKAIVADISLLF